MGLLSVSAVGIIFSVLFAVLGGAVVWFISRVIRRHFPHLSPPSSLTLSHTALVAVCIALYPILSARPPADDVFLPFYFVPGLHIYFLIEKLIVEPSTLFLFRVMSTHSASVIGIVFLPGLIGLLIGGIQWHAIGYFVERTRQRRLTRASALQKG